MPPAHSKAARNRASRTEPAKQGQSNRRRSPRRLFLLSWATLRTTDLRALATRTPPTHTPPTCTPPTHTIQRARKSFRFPPLRPTLQHSREDAREDFLSQWPDMDEMYDYGRAFHPYLASRFPNTARTPFAACVSPGQRSAESRPAMRPGNPTVHFVHIWPKGRIILPRPKGSLAAA